MLSVDQEQWVQPLTPREREIVAQLAQGVTRWRAIAERLCLSEHTVHFHIGNILLKFGLETSAQIAIYALTHGEIRDGAWHPRENQHA